MNPSTSLGDFQQTTLVLIPELILLFTAVGIMTGSAFISRPRRFWKAAISAAGAMLLLGVLLAASLNPERAERPVFTRRLRSMTICRFTPASCSC